MTGQQRREEILNMLKENKGYQNATQIASRFGVSRQIIVSDIAILRAQGIDIISTPRGYILEINSHSNIINAVACSHEKEQIQDEFFTIIDLGGCICDVLVEHPVYGQISAELNIRSRYEAELFMEKMSSESNKPLSALTGGLHVHRIETRTQEDFSRILRALKEKKIIYEE